MNLDIHFVSSSKLFSMGSGFGRSKSAVQSELAGNTFNTVGRVDVLDHRNLIASR